MPVPSSVLLLQSRLVELDLPHYRCVLDSGRRLIFTEKLRVTDVLLSVEDIRAYFSNQNRLLLIYIKTSKNMKLHWSKA